MVELILTLQHPGLDLYTYANADFMGICSWIPAVYFLGGPAVGNLVSCFKSYISILLTSCFMWNGALDSSGVLLSYPIVSIASHITTILISTFKYSNIYRPGSSIVAILSIRDSIGLVYFARL